MSSATVWDKAYLVMVDVILDGFLYLVFRFFLLLFNVGGKRRLQYLLIFPLPEGEGGRKSREEGRKHGDETRTMKEMHPAHPGNTRGKQKGKQTQMDSK